MPSYVLLARWTEQGVRTIADLPKRLDTAKISLQEMGGQFRQILMTMGEYDLVAIYEAPDDAVAAPGDDVGAAPSPGGPSGIRGPRAANTPAAALVTSPAINEPAVSTPVNTAAAIPRTLGSRIGSNGSAAARARSGSASPRAGARLSATRRTNAQITSPTYAVLANIKK